MFRNQSKISRCCDGAKTITCIGRLVHVKGVDVLLKAFSKIDNQRVQLQIVGEGDARHHLESLADELGLGERVSFLGNREDIESLLSETDLVVIASRREGFPWSWLRRCCAQPVVSTRVPGAAEILPQEVLADTENPDSLADRLNWALADASRLEKTFVPVYSFAEAALTHDHQLSATEAVLQDAARRGKLCAS